MCCFVYATRRYFHHVIPQDDSFEVSQYPPIVKIFSERNAEFQIFLHHAAFIPKYCSELKGYHMSLKMTTNPCYAFVPPLCVTFTCQSKLICVFCNVQHPEREGYCTTINHISTEYWFVEFCEEFTTRKRQSLPFMGAFG